MNNTQYSPLHPRRDRRFRRLWLICCLGMAVTSAQWARAGNGIEPFGVSTQSFARGGTDVAVGDSALSQVDNVATLTLTPRHVLRFDGVGILVLPRTSWHGPIDASNSQIGHAELANMGLAVPVNDRLTLGLVIHSKAGLGTQFEMRHLLIPFMHRKVGSDLKGLDLHLDAAYKLTDKLSGGVGVRVEAAIAEFNTVLGPADLKFGRGYSYGIGFNLGLLYQARPDLRFGLAYRSPGWMGDVAGGEGQARLFGLLPIPLGGINIEKLRLAQKISAGVAWDATDRLKLAGEVRWINNSGCTFHSAIVKSNGLIDVLYPFPLGYKDQWVIAAGAEFKLDEHWTLGTGYNWGTRPVASSNLLPMGSAIMRNHITAGLRYKKNNWWIGASYIRGFPSKLHGGGWSNILLGVDYGLSDMEQAEHAFAVGFGFDI